MLFLSCFLSLSEKNYKQPGKWAHGGKDRKGHGKPPDEEEGDAGVEMEIVAELAAALFLHW